MVGGGLPASAYALALAHLDCVKSLNMKQKRKRRMVSARNRPTIAGTVVSAKGPNASEKILVFDKKVVLANHNVVRALFCGQLTYAARTP